MPGHVVVVGSANVDYILRLPRLPRKGETITGGPFSQAFGGKGSNQAFAARRAGAAVTAVFNLGGDAGGRELAEAYQAEGIDSSRIGRNPDAVCGIAVILVDDNGDNTISLCPGANAAMTAEQVDGAKDVIAGAGILMLQMEIPDAPIQRAIDLAAAAGTEVMLNYAPARTSSVVLDAKIGILVVNEVEAQTLTGLAVDNPAAAARAAEKLAGNGHRRVIVTLGANGSLLWENGEARHVPAFPVAAMDTTAAGDTFCGALAAALGEGKDMAEAMRFASAAGALCASRQGALPSIPRREEIEAFLARHSG